MYTDVTVETLSGPKFILLSQGSHPARTGLDYNRLYYNITTQQTLDIVISARSSPILALDFETKGADYSDPALEVIGIGLAWDAGSCYIDWRSSPKNCKEIIIKLLLDHPGLIAHNVYFDGGVLRTLTDKKPSFYACTYALLALLHNESLESKWGLKHAQVNLLGWKESNERELDKWLCVNGYYIGVKRKNETPEMLEDLYAQGKLRPEKGEMWRAPYNILGKYCCLDAESCYLLYTEILHRPKQDFPGLEDWFHKYFMYLIEVLITQKQHGILIDRGHLLEYKKELESDVELITQDFLSLPEVQEPIKEIEAELRSEIYDKVPAEYTSKGAPSKMYLNWQNKVKSILAGENPKYNFNIQSSDQLRNLLYDKLKMPVLIMTDNETKPQPGVSTKALQKMGVVGEILVERSDRIKSLSFVGAYLEMIEHRNTIHPSFRTPGTVTGRLSGKEPNLQQMAKTYKMMSSFVARPGHVFVDLDFASLEPTVTTEFSEDKNMEVIYGNSASPYQDFYLYIASSIPGIREKVIAAGYDPENPTKEGTANTKKVCKHERNICKVVALACAYGSGAKNVHAKLEEQNVFLSMEEVYKVHSGYWELFSQVKDFGKSLYYEWKRNKGFIVNGVGRPMAVPEEYTKDLLNRFVQSTGHDILIIYIRILCEELETQGIPYRPIIIDLHDASTIEVPEEYKDPAIQAFRTAMDKLNKHLGGRIKLKGTPVAGKNLGDVKEAE